MVLIVECDLWERRESQPVGGCASSIPLFRRPAFHEVEMHDGEPANFIMEVPLITASSDRFWLLNSTSLYLEPAPQFT